MNILIPHSWLLEHLDTKASPKKIQECLSLCGPSIERIYDREGESIYDIEVTTNRVDSMSVRGIAREAATILPQFGIKAKLKKLNINKNLKQEVKLGLPNIIDSDKWGKRIICIVLANVQRTKTPAWMAKRLIQTEMNIHDSIIDITNYITHELGHPIHAFDYDKIMELGGEIIVTEARKGKKFQTLDGEKFTTIGGEIIFENSKKQIIDLPAIKGTTNSSINENTKNVLLWIENIPAEKIRFASMSHAIRTVAAQLGEKHVDPYLAEDVLYGATNLYQKLCHAQIASKVYDDFPAKKKLKEIKLDLEIIKSYLGIELEINKIGEILESLGCEVSLIKGQLIVQPPTFRQDLKIPADIIEEIARIYGYHNLPSVLMPTAIPLSKQKDINFNLENKIKHFLANIGWQEVYTYSMVEKGTEKNLKLLNPLTDDKVYLRRSLISSLKKVLKKNPQKVNLSVFEIANIYLKKLNDLPNEELHLTMVSNNSFRAVKGELGALLMQFFPTNLEIKQKENSGEIYFDKIYLGEIKVKNKLVIIDILVKELVKIAKKYPKYQPLPKTAGVIEDLTFVLPKQTLIGDVIKTITKTNKKINIVKLKNIYKNNYSFVIEYLDKKQNLSNQDIAPIRKEVVDKVEQEFKAKLIGEVK